MPRGRLRIVRDIPETDALSDREFARQVTAIAGPGHSSATLLEFVSGPLYGSLDQA